MGVITAYRQTLFLDLKREMPRQCHLFSDHTSQFGTQRRIRDPRILCNRALTFGNPANELLLRRSS